MSKAATPVTPLYSPETVYFSRDGKFSGAVRPGSRGGVGRDHGQADGANRAIPQCGV